MKKVLIILITILLLTGCQRNAPGKLNNTGWYNITQSNREDVSQALISQSKELINNSFTATYKINNEIIKFEKNNKDFIRFKKIINNKEIIIYQRYLQERLVLPQTVVCYLEFCHDISIDILFNRIVEGEYNTEFLSISYHEILKNLLFIISNPYRWEYLADLSATSLNLYRSKSVNGEILSTKLGLEDRIYIKGKAKHSKDSICVGYFDTYEDIATGSTRGGWCFYKGLLTNDANGKIISFNFSDKVDNFNFPQKYSKNLKYSQLSEAQKRNFYLFYPEYDKDFLYNLLN
jgi:hypothetical protein